METICQSLGPGFWAALKCHNICFVDSILARKIQRVRWQWEPYFCDRLPLPQASLWVRDTGGRREPQGRWGWGTERWILTPRVSWLPRPACWKLHSLSWVKLSGTWNYLVSTICGQFNLRCNILFGSVGYDSSWSPFFSPFRYKQNHLCFMIKIQLNTKMRSPWMKGATLHIPLMPRGFWNPTIRMGLFAPSSGWCHKQV